MPDKIIFDGAVNCLRSCIRHYLEREKPPHCPQTIVPWSMTSLMCCEEHVPQSLLLSLLYGDRLLVSRFLRGSVESGLDPLSSMSRSVRRSGRSSRRLCSRLRDLCLRLSSRSPSLRLSLSRDLERSRWCLCRRSRSRERLRERCLLFRSPSSSLCLRDFSFFSLFLCFSSSSPSLAFSSSAPLTSSSCTFLPSGVRFALSRTGTGKPIAASMASSSASLSLRFSSLMRAASASFDWCHERVAEVVFALRVVLDIFPFEVGATAAVLRLVHA
jgi:hypothetical protein